MPIDRTLEIIERKLEALLRDIRIYRKHQQAATKDKGVLGSRGLTEFIIEQLKNVPSGFSAHELLTLADRAGYQITTTRTMSKRLTLRSYRHGDIRFNQQHKRWQYVPITPKGEN
jgi:hypothetical protein